MNEPQGSAPGPNARLRGGHGSYMIGFVVALLLTMASFAAASSNMVYGPGVPVLLAVFAVAQMGIHLVFFFHISSAPDQANNFTSLAFGVFVVGLVIFGSLIIMSNLNHMMPSMDELMKMQR